MSNVTQYSSGAVYMTASGYYATSSVGTYGSPFYVAGEYKKSLDDLVKEELILARKHIAELEKERDAMSLKFKEEKAPERTSKGPRRILDL
jgi:hypothetical protein